MKKLIISAFVLATVASCAKNEVTDVVTSADNAISFSGINDRMTKAANVSTDNYMVYAYSNLANESTWFMEAVVGGASGATYSADGSIEIPYYWPEESATINFRGYCPDATSIGSSATVPSTGTEVDCYLTGGNGTVSSVDYANKTVAFTYYAGLGKEDLTLADMVTTVDKSSGSVALNFAHLLSAVTIDVMLSDNMKELGYAIANSPTDQTVTSPYSVSLLMPRKRAIFTFGFDSENADAYTMTYPVDANGDYISAASATYTDAPSVLHYVIPQELLLSAETTATNSDVNARAYVNDLEITYNGGAYYFGTTNVNLTEALAEACEISEFKAGTRYNITIVFDDGAPAIFDRKITFTATDDAWDVYDIVITVGNSTTSEFVTAD